MIHDIIISTRQTAMHMFMVSSTAKLAYNNTGL